MSANTGGRRCLVTGGAGFIGSWWVQHLVRHGHEVTVLDNCSTGAPDHLPQEVRFVQGDIAEEGRLRQLVAEVDTVFHLAAVVGVRYGLENRVLTMMTNVVGGINVVRACAESERELVMTSSSAIYGKASVLPIPEEADVTFGNTHIPSWTYGLSKLADEAIARAWHDERGLDVKIVRPFNCIGPRQSGAYGMVVPRFIDAALHGKPLVVYGDGEQTRTFTYIEDLVQGIDRVWRRGKGGEVYNVGGDQEVSVNTLASRVLALTGSTSRIEHVPFARAFGPYHEEIQRRVPDISKARSLGYEPKYALDDSLRAIIEWFLSK